MHEITTHTNRIPKFDPTIMHRKLIRTPGRKQLRTCVLCAENDTSRRTGYVIKWGSVTVVIYVREHLNWKYTDRYVDCGASSEMFFTGQADLPMIQRIIKKGMKRAVKTVMSDSNANPLQTYSVSQRVRVRS
jgi:hypothetical protein